MPAIRPPTISAMIIILVKILLASSLCPLPISVAAYVLAPRPKMCVRAKIRPSIGIRILMPARAFCPTKRETKSASSRVSNRRDERLVSKPGSANFSSDPRLKSWPIFELLSLSMHLFYPICFHFIRILTAFCSNEKTPARGVF